MAGQSVKLTRFLFTGKMMPLFYAPTLSARLQVAFFVSAPFAS
jgi:hypothetical protein